MSLVRRLCIATVIVIFGAGAASFAAAQAAPKPTNHWLLDAKDDKERFKRIEDMFGGFSGAMIIVGERFDRTYDAIADGNPELARYHWSKVKEAIEAGYLRRPGRETNAVHMFLEGPWKPLSDALGAKDNAKAKEAFLAARSACMACHIAEKVAFMNDQQRFRRTAAFSR
jgi:hypothetical protein